MVKLYALSYLHQSRRGVVMLAAAAAAAGPPSLFRWAAAKVTCFGGDSYNYGAAHTEALELD